jgi:CTP:molybdopterin cytidylyltransferase MocA
LNVHVILLAAGGSTRLGRPKQLELVSGITLVGRAALVCLGSRAATTHVVVGAHEDAVREELSALPVALVSNPQWRDGLSTSIRAGLAAAAGADAVLLVLADQPALRSSTLDALITATDTPAAIAACDYGDRLGPPACFGSAHFPALAALEGDRGARDLFDRFGVTAVPCPEGALDVDTEEDLHRARDDSDSRG